VPASTLRSQERLSDRSASWSSDTAMADGLPDEIFRSSTVSLPVDETKVGKINLNRNVPVLAS
jgi:hypothetical protein